MVEERLAPPLNEATPLLERIITHVDRFYPPSAETGASDLHCHYVAGHYRYRKRVVHRMPYYEDVKEMPWEMRWSGNTGVPVYIQYDISAPSTMAVSAFGASRGARDVIRVVIDHTVGRGVNTDGHLLRAGSSSLVEIGHAQNDPAVSAVIAVIMAVWRPSPASIACWNLRSFGLINR